MENYINKALRTESIEGAGSRLNKSINNFMYVYNVLNAINSEVDALKKYVYYGKESTVLPTDGLDLDINVSEEQIRLLHAGLGLLTEAEEFLRPILDSIMKSIPLDKVNLKEELGDAFWYQAIACDVLGTTFEIEQERNITKLQQRYPEKFDSDKAINRDLEAERNILEQ